MQYIKTLNSFNSDESISIDDVNSSGRYLDFIGKKISSFRYKPNNFNKTLDVMAHDYFDYFETNTNRVDENKLKSIHMPDYIQV